jgi:hypothetical protein
MHRFPPKKKKFLDETSVFLQLFSVVCFVNLPTKIQKMAGGKRFVAYNRALYCTLSCDTFYVTIIGRETLPPVVEIIIIILRYAAGCPHQELTPGKIATLRLRHSKMKKKS